MLLDVKSAEGTSGPGSVPGVADVVSQNFALGVADRLGIGEADARAGLA